ncbi:MAG: hypothetical protein J5865_00235 [Lachnospiraceae bacterium]|nr:hypothetical protein [Lachnospiraceae bacterium]
MKKQQVVKMRQRKHIFFGVIIFLMVLAYLTYHAVSFLTREKPAVYTIGEQTSLAQNRSYTGLIIRQERVEKTERPGIVNYYVPASSRVSVNDVVYSVDETGNFTKIAAEEGFQHVRNTDVSEFLNEYSSGYDGKDFSSVYDLKYELNSRLLLSASAAELERFARDFITGFEMHKAAATGLVEYYVDGFEEFNEASITAEDFDRSAYEKKQLSAMTQAAAGDPVYKLITTEAWDIYIPLTTSEAASMTETKSVKVRFTEADLETTVRFSLVHGADDNYFGKLTLTKYLLRYADSRYLKLELLREEKSGLQIPKSAAAEEELYVIPADYLTTGGNSDSYGFQTRPAGDTGALATFTPVSILYKNDTFCYIEKKALEQGTVLVKPGSTETFRVLSTEKLTGAYNVNRGYAVFKVFEVLDESEDYYIIKNGSYNGLSAYDKILLYPTFGMNGDFIY